METRKEYLPFEKAADSSLGKESVWMNYNLDGQMDFSDFPEILPEGGN